MHNNQIRVEKAHNLHCDIHGQWNHRIEEDKVCGIDVLALIRLAVYFQVPRQRVGNRVRAKMKPQAPIIIPKRANDAHGRLQNENHDQVGIHTVFHTRNLVRHNGRRVALNLRVESRVDHETNAPFSVLQLGPAQQQLLGAERDAVGAQRFEV